MKRTTHLPPPASAEARAEGCTCPLPLRAEAVDDPAAAIDENCPVHGSADPTGISEGEPRAAERGPIDVEGDIADSAEEQELRRE